MDDFGDETHTFKDLSLTDLHDGKFQVGSGPEQEPDAQAEASAGDEKGKKKPGKGGKKGRGKGSKKAAEPKNAKGAGPTKKQPASTCIVPGCLAPKYPGSRFCSLNDHKRSWDNMCYQRRSRRDITDSQRQSFDESMKQEDVAGREVLIFHRDNPPECRKKSLIDFARFERIRGVRNSLKDSDGDVPMTERQFYKHCENVLGLTEEEMTEFWKELQDNPRIERDNDGWRGAEQLWVPAHKMRLREKEKYVDNRHVEGSGDMKAPTTEQRDMLGKHLTRQDQGFQDEHFNFSAAERSDTKTGPQPTTPTKKTAKAAASNLDDPTPEKTINLTRERPNLCATMERGIKKLEADLKKSLQHAAAMKPQHSNFPAELKASDRVLLTFCRTAQFRHELVAQILGQSAEICQLVPDEGHAADPAAAPGTPASAMTGAVDAKLDELEKEKKAMTFEVFMQQSRLQDQKYWDLSTEDVKSLDQLRDLMDIVMAAPSSEKFLAAKAQWEKANKALAEISKGLKLATDDVLKHMKVKLSERERDNKRKAENDAKEQLAKVRKAAKEAAEAIKQKKALEAQGSTASLFQSTFSDGIPQVHVWDGRQMDAVDWCKPWLLEKPQAMADALKDGALQKSLAIWGAQYKKAMAAHKLDVATFPVADGQGREAAAQAFATWQADDGHVDVSSVAGGKEFEKGVWLFGCSSDLKTVTHTPNYASLFKTLTCGEIKHFLLERASLIDGLKKIGKHDADFIEAFKACGTECLAKLLKEGVKIQRCDLAAASVLYVPAGWIQVELVDGHSLIYGIRKSWFHKQNKIAYASSVELVRASGKGSVGRMEAILQLLSK